MAKIKNAHPKQSGGGYERLVGNPTLAELLTKAQSTVISNGTELEKIISSRAVLIKHLDEFIDHCDDGLMPEGAYLCTKKVLKQSKYRLKGHEPDFLAFTLHGHKGVCYVVELKDGDTFDTKKSAAEREMLQIFVNHLAPQIPFRTRPYICCFNQPDKSKIVTGFKHTFPVEEVMTGAEFCQILGIDYDEILSMRKNDTLENFDYFVRRMAELPEVQRAVDEAQRRHIVEDDFYPGSDTEEDVTISG